MWEIDQVSGWGVGVTKSQLGGGVVGGGRFYYMVRGGQVLDHWCCLPPPPGHGHTDGCENITFACFDMWLVLMVNSLYHVSYKVKFSDLSQCMYVEGAKCLV